LSVQAVKRRATAAAINFDFDNYDQYNDEATDDDPADPSLT